MVVVVVAMQRVWPRWWSGTSVQQATDLVAQLTMDDPSAVKFPLPYEALAELTEITGLPKQPAETCKVIYSGNETSTSSSLEHMRFPFDPAQPYSQRNPHYAKVVGARCLTTKDAVKRTLHLELDVEAMNWQYTPGDAFGVLSPNNQELVLKLLARLGLKGDATFTLEPTDGASKGLFLVSFSFY